MRWDTRRLASSRGGVAARPGGTSALVSPRDASQGVRHFDQPEQQIFFLPKAASTHSKLSAVARANSTNAEPTHLIHSIGPRDDLPYSSSVVRSSQPQGGEL
jgi:hypothetical protein